MPPRIANKIPIDMRTPGRLRLRNGKMGQTAVEFVCVGEGGEIVDPLVPATFVGTDLGFGVVVGRIVLEAD
jgi:hypothetical protein